MTTKADWADTEVMPLPSLLRAAPMVYPVTEQRSALREVLTTAFRDRWRIALAFLIPFIATIALSFLPSPRYTSESTLLLRLGREYFYKPETGDAFSAQPVAFDREQTLHAEVEILTSRDVGQAVLDKLGVAAVYPKIAKSPKDAAAQRDIALIALQSDFDAVLMKDTNVVHLKFTHRDPRVAAKVLGTIVDTYLERRRSIFNTASTVGAEADVASLRGRLGKAEKDYDDLKRAHRIESFGEQQTLLLGQRQSVEMRLADNAVALSQATGRSSALRVSLANTPEHIELSNETQRSESVESVRKTLLDLRLKERDLSSKFTDSSPIVKDVRTDIGRTEAFLRDLQAQPNRIIKTGRSQVRDGVESELVRSMADQRQAAVSRATLLTQRDEIDERLTELSSSQRELETLDRERKLIEAAYATATKRLEEERVLQHLDEMRKSNVAIVQAAREPLEARSIRPIIIAVGTVFSLACALLVAFVSSLWRDTFLLPDDVQRSLKLPLLAAVPKVTLR